MKTHMRDGSGKREYRYLKEDVDRHGNARVYFRRKGQPKIRMKAIPGTADFDREYQLAFAGIPTTAPKRGTVSTGTLQWLVNQYYASAVYQTAAKGTRDNLRSALGSICEEIGDLPYAMIEPRHIAALRDKKAATPAAATLRVQALRRLFKWACDPEYGPIATVNPAEKVTYLQSANPEGIKPWTEADVQKYEARHPLGTPARLAFDLLLYTGVRRSDVVRLGPQMERDGKLVFSEFKGRRQNVKTHELPILSPLRASIDATPAGHLVYLADRQGKPYRAPSFGEWFKSQCGKAGVDPELSAHGLRKLAATRFADAGASVHQLCSWFGWMKLAQAETYTRNVDRSRLAVDAALLLEASR